MHRIQFLKKYFPILQIVNCVNLCDFLQLCKYYVGVICTKGKKGANVKTSYKFGNGPMKSCFKHKIKIKVDHRNIRIVYIYVFLT